ncbi:hypothetical protein [Corynebacterium sp. HMSC073D01]|nr:hypothetical protein [Corynebacterium sp. HMSC073D01]
MDESLMLRGENCQEYMICATVLELDQCERIRDALVPLLLPGQTKLHWTDEQSKRRREIAKSISALGCHHVIVSTLSQESRKTERYRRKCLERLYYEVSEMKISRVTLESRQKTQNQKDIEHIVALQGSGLYRDIRLKHINGSDEPLLWIPDVVLGMYNATFRGEQQYWREFERKVVCHAI